MTEKYNPFNVNLNQNEFFRGFRCIGLIAELAKDYETAEYFYRHSGYLYQAYQMKKNQKTIEEKTIRNKRLSKKFKERVISN